MPFAARETDLHVCPQISGTVPHVGGPINAGCPTVKIGGLSAARVGDLCTCAAGGPDSITKGSATVNIGGAPAARFGDNTAHGGIIVMGCFTVNIGG